MEEWRDDEPKDDNLIRLTDVSVPVRAEVEVGVVEDLIAENAFVRAGNMMDVMMMVDW